MSTCTCKSTRNPSENTCPQTFCDIFVLFRIAQNKQLQQNTFAFYFFFYFLLLYCSVTNGFYPRVFFFLQSSFCRSFCLQRLGSTKEEVADPTQSSDGVDLGLRAQSRKSIGEPHRACDLARTPAQGNN